MDNATPDNTVRDEDIDRLRRVAQDALPLEQLGWGYDEQSLRLRAGLDSHVTTWSWQVDDLVDAVRPSVLLALLDEVQRLRHVVQIREAEIERLAGELTDAFDGRRAW